MNLDCIIEVYVKFSVDVFIILNHSYIYYIALSINSIRAPGLIEQRDGTEVLFDAVGSWLFPEIVERCQYGAVATSAFDN